MQTLAVLFCFIQAGPPPASPFHTLTASEAGSLLLVRSTSKTGFRYSTGIVVDADRRQALVAWHAVSGESTVLALASSDAPDSNPQATSDAFKSKRGLRATVIYAEPWHDLALIQLAELPASSRAIPRSTERPAPDSALSLAGQPYEKNIFWQRLACRAETAADANWTWADGQRIGTRMLTVKAESDLGHGFSGGAVRNGKGELVGIVVAGSGSTIYAVETPVINRFLDRAEFVRTALGTDRRNAIERTQR